MILDIEGSEALGPVLLYKGRVQLALPEDNNRADDLANKELSKEDTTYPALSQQQIELPSSHFLSTFKGFQTSIRTTLHPLVQSSLTHALPLPPLPAPSPPTTSTFPLPSTSSPPLHPQSLPFLSPLPLLRPYYPHLVGGMLLDLSPAGVEVCFEDVIVGRRGCGGRMGEGVLGGRGHRSWWL